MKLLAIDAVTEACSVALYNEGELLVREQLVAQQHTELLLPLIAELLAEGGLALHALDAIVFDRGPGSFTGLRVCTGVAQGLALGADLPVIPVSSLATLAQGAWRLDQAGHVLACIDARQGEVYWSAYVLSEGLMTPIIGEAVSPPQAVKLDTTYAWTGVGSGVQRYAAELAALTAVSLTPIVETRFPMAQDMLPFAMRAWTDKTCLDAGSALPVYLRDNVATPPGK